MSVSLGRITSLTGLVMVGLVAFSMLMDEIGPIWTGLLGMSLFFGGSFLTMRTPTKEVPA